MLWRTSCRPRLSGPVPPGWWPHSCWLVRATPSPWSIAIPDRRGAELGQAQRLPVPAAARLPPPIATTLSERLPEVFEDLLAVDPVISAAAGDAGAARDARAAARGLRSRAVARSTASRASPGCSARSSGWTWPATAYAVWWSTGGCSRPTWSSTPAVGAGSVPRCAGVPEGGRLCLRLHLPAVPAAAGRRAGPDDVPVGVRAVLPRLPGADLPRGGGLLQRADRAGADRPRAGRTG